MERKISPYQLFATMFAFPYGSAVLFYLAQDAKQDAWIAMLFYIVPALLLQSIYIYLFRAFPRDSLVTYLPKVFGRYLGLILSVTYILYFEYLSARVLRDFSELINISSMPQTPILLISVLICITVIYGVTTGIETLCRISGLLFPSMIFGLFIAFFLLAVSRSPLSFSKIMPILEQGPINTILKSWSLITFPYGETIAFTMLYKDLNEPPKVKKAVFLAIISEGLILSCTTLMLLATLGVNYASISTFPLLDTLRLIKVGGFLDRLDIIIIIYMVIGGFLKISIYMYVSALGASELLKLKRPKPIVVPFGVVTLLVAQFIAKNYAQHIKIGLDITVKYIHLPLQIGVPLIAFVIVLFKNKNKKLLKN